MGGKLSGMHGMMNLMRVAQASPLAASIKVIDIKMGENILHCITHSRTIAVNTTGSGNMFLQ